MFKIKPEYFSKIVSETGHHNDLSSKQIDLHRGPHLKSAAKPLFNDNGSFQHIPERRQSGKITNNFKHQE
ncbi:MAG: hypothetical protein Q4F84_03945 [Fibrobacter sp.]|nr:hypothetical protein [Fibrobacter sp.]